MWPVLIAIWILGAGYYAQDFTKYVLRNHLSKVLLFAVLWIVILWPLYLVMDVGQQDGNRKWM
jgi:hypothetical protein